MSRLRRGLLLGLGLGLGLAVLLWPKAPTLVVRDAEGRAAVLIQNVRVIDVRTGTATAAQDVLLKGDRIHTIRPTGGPVPRGAQVIEGAGLSLMPGLIDAHCHVGSSPEPPWDKGLPDEDLNLERMLYTGVTTVFDPGAVAPDIFELRAALASGERLGPHLLAAGPIFTAPGGHPEPMMRELMPGLLVDLLVEGMTRQVATAAEARAAVQGLLPMQPDFIKLAIDRIPLDAPRLTPEAARGIVAAAEAGGLRTVAHIGTYEDALEAAEAGVSAWIHGVYKQPLDDAQVAKLASFGIPMVPTMVVFESYGKMGRGDFSSTALEAEIAPASLLDGRAERPEGYEVSERSLELLDLIAAQREAGRANVRRLHAAGVTMLAGSDAQATVLHGAGLHRELGLLAAAGLPPQDVLRAATWHAARFLSGEADPEYGAVAVGKRADLVLVRGDPLADVGALSKIEAVILDGRPLERRRYPR